MQKDSVMKKLTPEEFIEKAKEIHGNKYDYSTTVYDSSRKKVTVICPEHGPFEVWPMDHLRGVGCGKCFNAYGRGKTRQERSKEKFIEKAMKIHGDRYDYSKVVYEKAKKDVCIICPEHGEFWISPNKHLSGRGCQECSRIERNKKLLLGKEKFIEKAIKVHGDKYDYSKVVYNGNKKEVCIICPEHGEFWQKPNAHLSGEGCYKCKYKIYDTESFIKEAKRVHGDKYDYSKVVYKGADENVCIICPEHGEFWQTPRNHVHNTAGCPTCNESKLERETRNYLKRKGIKFKYQKRFNWLGYQSLDFYLPDYNIGIECQGIQHFEPVDFSGKGNAEKCLEEVKRLDKRKRELCEEKKVILKYINYDENVEEKIDSILKEAK